MDRLEKFKIVIRKEFSDSTSSNEMLEALYEKLSQEYIDSLISEFNFEEIELKTKIKDAICNSAFLNEVYDSNYWGSKKGMIEDNNLHLNDLINSIYRLVKGD